MTPDAECEASNAHRESDEVMNKKRERKDDICVCPMSSVCVCVGQYMTVSICCPVSSAKSHDF